MTSFKRKGTAKQSVTQTGAKISPASPSTSLISTGIPSLDDILGGGLPLSCSLVIAAPDHHSSYGELAQKYFIAQGLKAGHRVCVIADDAKEFVKDVMWTPRNSQPLANDEEYPDDQEGQKIKIAWRYEQMKSFQTTVSSVSSSPTDDFCHTFDLSNRIPQSLLEDAISSGSLSCVSMESSPGSTSTQKVLSQIVTLLQTGKGVGPTVAQPPLRICIPSLGSPWWGKLSDQHILSFLHSLRATLRRHPHTCASISLAPHLSALRWGGPGWIQKLGWTSDAVLSLAAFSADPSLIATFPNYHGFLHIHSLPAPHTLLVPSDRFSALRGLSASAGHSGGTENNITFKSTRKRLVFETLHLDIEGGVGERRTTAPHTAAPDHVHDHMEAHPPKTALPVMEVMLEDLTPEKPHDGGAGGAEVGTKVPEVKQKKPKKQVAFRADRPDLYDF